MSEKVPEKKEKVHYVDNKEFHRHMVIYIDEYKKAKKEKRPPPQVTDFIGLCFVQIANKLANSPNFINYPFREEMIADGIENCLTYIHNFNPSKYDKPFAYFTRMIFYAFVRRIQKEKKQLYTKFKAIENNLLHDVPESDFIHNSKYGSDYSDNFMREFIDTFEKGREKRKKKIKKTKSSKDALDID